MLFKFNMGIFIFFIQTTALFSQTTGSISGKVIDAETKHPLVGANVVIAGTQQGAATDTEGKFFINNVEENIHSLEVHYIGYQSYLETDVRVVRDKTTFVQEIELVPTTIESDEVTVTAGQFRDHSHAPVSFHTYNREEIRRSPGAAGDIFRAIESMPGVSTSGGEFSAFSVRGGNPKENIVLIDNIPFDKVSHFDGGDEDEAKQGGRFSIFAPNLIEDAEFQAGGFSAIYGGKNASLLNLKIREGNQDDFTIDGRFDITGWEANYNGKLYGINNTGIIISARHTDFSQILDLTGQDDLGIPKFTDFIVKTTSNINPSHKLSLLAIYSPEDFTRDTKHVFKSDNFATNDLSNLDETKTLFGINWRILTGQNTVLQNTVYYRNTDTDFWGGRATPTFNNGSLPQSEKDFNSRFTLNENTKETEIGARSLFTWVQSPGTIFTAGIDISNTKFDRNRKQFGLDTLFVFDKDDFRSNSDQNYIVASPDKVNASFNDRKTLFAAFTDLSINPIERLTLNAGVRYEYSQFNKENYISPRISSTYRLNPKTRLNFAAGIYYQNPEFEILTLSNDNLNLKNEKAYHVIAGISRYIGDDLKFTLEGYYKLFDNLLVRPDRTNNIFINAGDGWAGGFDVSLVKKFVDDFYGQVSYSYSQSKRDDHNGEGEYNSDFNQPHIFNILVGYEFSKEWSISTKWRYATGRPTDSYIVHNNIFNGPNFIRYSKEIISNNTDRLSDFHTFNIRVDFRKQIFDRLAIVSYLDVVNVYNHTNVNKTSFLELTGKDDEGGFGILPTIGVKLEF